MAKANLGKAYVQIVPSADGITGSISKLIEPEANKAGNTSGKSFGKKFIAAVGAAGITTAITKFFTDSVKQGAALEQSIGGVKKLYGEAADTIIANANRAYKTAGMSANQYMEQSTTFAASLVKSLGGNTAEAARIADQAIIDMADNVNAFGTPMESVTAAFNGFAKGQYQLLDNLKLGYAGTKEGMLQLLSDAEKLTGVKYDITNLSDVYNAVHAIQGELGITGATAKEAETTVSGSFASMKAAYDNLLGGMAIGEDVKPLLEDLAETVGVFLGENLIPMILTAVKGLFKGVFGLIADGGKQLVDNLNDWGKRMYDGFWSPFKKANESLKTWWADLKARFAERLKFSGIDLPHIQISYKTTGTMAEIAKKLGLKGVPQFSVEWYAKGGIFSNPSLIGVGEAGSEAVVPLNRFWNEIDNMANKIVERIDSINGNQQPIYCYVTLDGKVIAKATAPYMDNELGNIQGLKERGIW